jgi:hypothetical protein
LEHSNAGYQHFLVRGFDKVRGEWSLMALCYNFTRVLNILGFDEFAAAVENMLISLLHALADAIKRLQYAPKSLLSRFAQQTVIPGRQSVLLS